MSVDPTGKQIAVNDNHGGVNLCELPGGKLVLTIKDANRRGMAFSPDGKRLALISSTEVILCNTATGQKEAECSLDKGYY